MQPLEALLRSWALVHDRQGARLSACSRPAWTGEAPPARIFQCAVPKTQLCTTGVISMLSGDDAPGYNLVTEAVRSTVET